MARAAGIALPISFKQSVEICNFIRNKSANEAKKMLQMVADKKSAVPFRRYNWDLSHKKKIGPGRYPEKASKEFIKLIEAAEANAQFKGLNTSNLVISHISANNGGKAWHYGRQSRRKMKRTSIQIIVEETKSQAKKPAESKEKPPRQQEK